MSSSSTLTEATWRIGGVRFRVVAAAHALLVAVDDDWVPRRRASDAHDWRWAAVYEGGGDIFLVKADDQFVAAWGCWTEELKELSVGPCYRLDFFEVEPDRRGDRLTAAVAIAFVAKRAIDLGAHNVILGSLPESAGFYESVGAIPGKIPNWKTRRDLLPYRFDRVALEALAERLDENREDHQEEA